MSLEISFTFGGGAEQLARVWLFTSTWNPNPFKMLLNHREFTPPSKPDIRILILMP